MQIVTRALAATALAAAVASPAAGMNDFQSGGEAFKIYKAQLGIAPAGGGCPMAVNLQGWVFMSHPTTIEVMIARKGQGVVSGPHSITSVKAGNGQYMATYSHQFVVNTSVHAEYGLFVGGGSGTTSNWAPLDIDC